MRNYRESDEQSWVRCRVISFLDTSYLDDVHRYREKFEHEAICLVAVLEGSNEVIGLMDTEIDAKPGEDGRLRATIWALAVLPEYRKRGVAGKLWKATLQGLAQAGVSTVEVWTQDDADANRWYQQQGFEQFTAYLNVYARGRFNQGDKSPVQQLLPEAAENWRYGYIRNLNFEASLEHRAELEALSYRLHEVRGYRLQLTP